MMRYHVELWSLASMRWCALPVVWDTLWFAVATARAVEYREGFACRVVER